MASENPAPGAFPDPEGFAKYRTLLIECKKLAMQLFPKVKAMFPGGVKEMLELDPAFSSPDCPFREKANALEDQLALLQDM